VDHSLRAELLPPAPLQHAAEVRPFGLGQFSMENCKGIREVYVTVMSLSSIGFYDILWVCHGILKIPQDSTCPSHPQYPKNFMALQNLHGIGMMIRLLIEAY